MIVSVDGSGDFISIQQAINSIPKNNSKRVIIYIKNGVYKEKLHIDTSFISLIGESKDKTIITYDDYALKKFPSGELYNTFNSYSVFIGADDFIAENITFENSAGRGNVVGQAVAVYADGDRLSFKNCRFLGHQDTLFTGPLPPSPIERSSFGGPRDNAERRKVRQYYENCYIEGDIDFIFGSATAVFNKCEIFALNRLSDDKDCNLEESNKTNGYLTAASTPEDVPYGYVFIDCKLTGDAPSQTVYLGRPWRIYSKVAFINCWMGECIKAEGWHNWDKPESEMTTKYCEYNSTGPGAAMDSRVGWSKILTKDESEKFSIYKILSGNDGWNPQYYTSLPKLHKRYEEESRSLAFKAANLEEYELWKTQLRSKLLEITGMDKLMSCPLEPQLIESKLMDGYRRNKLIIQTEEEVWMPFYILTPSDLKDGEKRPVVIAPHGHLGGGKESIAGRTDIPEIKDSIERFNYNYGEQLVKESYIVFCPDARGFGERREYWMQGDDKDKVLNGSCIHLNNTAVSMGYSLTGFMAWDLIRLIDYIETLQFCDSSRIGCCGFSGGGLQTLWLTALDDRVKCAVISGYFYGSKDSLLEMTNCGCNYVPHLWKYADMGDLGALMAPRALLIESGRNDHLNGKRGIENVIEQLEITKKAYSLFSGENKLLHHVGEGGHYWYAERTLSFLKKEL